MLRSFGILIVATAAWLFASGTHARTDRGEFILHTSAGPVRVEHFGSCLQPVCPAVIILGGSRGPGAPAYDDLGKALKSSGMNAYLVHILSPADLEVIAKAGSARARIAYYTRRMPEWTTAVQGAVAHLRNQANHGGKVGILGVSLGAQVALAASAGRGDLDALVVVDGGFPDGYGQPVRFLPPLLLIWGSADRTFPVSVGENLQQTAQKLGSPVTLDIYEGGAHDFFLRSGRNAEAAHHSAVNFLRSHLCR